MTRFAISWSLDGRPFARALDPAEMTMLVIGREPGVEIHLPLPTVSRRQARLAWTGNGYELENLSATNPVVLDGRAVSTSASLSDGSSIRAGDAILIVHDLTAADQIGGPRCSHCGRENKSGDAECWFCGTSLVNAPTAVRTKHRLILRLVDAGGSRSDLVEGQGLHVGSTGALEARPAAAPGEDDADAPVIAIDEGRAIARNADAVRVEDQAGRRRTDGQIETGDVVVAGGRTYAAIAR